MSFVDFWFYPAVVALFILLASVQFFLRKREKTSNLISKVILLLFGYFLMALYDRRFCLCISAVILLTYGLAIAIEKSHDRKRRWLTGLAVAILLLFLGVFKYLNFFLSTLLSLGGKTWSEINIILPLGISFYIFSAVSYILDVSWEIQRADRSLLDVALFLSFFPKLICGPIVKGREFLPQLKENRKITLKRIESGIQILVFGLFKKMVIADHLAVFVDEVYAAPAAFGTATVWLAVFSYYLQLYFDFSGYSDMAIGMSRMLGYDIGRNFNMPFIARNIEEFWNRWHISLTSCLNEYVFNPVVVGLKRKMAGLPAKKRKKYKSLPVYAGIMVTFLVSGIWHGAGFTFLVWGLCHGVCMVIHHAWTERNRKHCAGHPERKSAALTALCILVNYFLLNLLQVFFRADSLKQAIFIFGRMFTGNIGIEQPYTWTFFAYAVLAGAIAAIYRRRKVDCLKEAEGYYPQADLGTVKGLTCFFVFCGLTLFLAYFGETYFIYGRF